MFKYTEVKHIFKFDSERCIREIILQIKERETCMPICLLILCPNSTGFVLGK